MRIVRKNNEDCCVVPPLNDNYFTLAPFVAALGHETVVRARDTSRSFCTGSAIFNCLFSHRYTQKPCGTVVASILFVLAIVSASCVVQASEQASDDSTARSGPEITLVLKGKPSATIITASNPTPAARLAALELQTHVRKITGAVLSIKTDRSETSGTRVLVGESAATRELGLKGTDFESQAYLIRFLPNTVVLIGRDWQDTEENRRELGSSTNWLTLAQLRKTIDYAAATNSRAPRASGKNMVTLPGFFDDQGTCYAAYDFLERFCHVRWYGPTELNIVLPRQDTLTVRGRDIRRSPAIRYREGMGGGWPMIKVQWDNPSPDQLDLYWRRLRQGGEKWAGNHSFVDFDDRFLKQNPQKPELFEAAHPEYFAVLKPGQRGERQLCYTNPGLIKQVARDARDFFDGKALRGHQPAMGDYFSIIPLDNAQWCRCDQCQALVRRDKAYALGEHFSTGRASHYWFNFVNAVARDLRRTHPDKYLSTLAYHVYAFAPEDFQVEANVAIAPCLQPRNYWAPRIEKNDMAFYRQWTKQKDRRVYLWNYYCFPTEPAVIQKWHCFPGSNAHGHAKQITMYHQDGVRGVFLCGIGEQLDFYLTMKLYDDPKLDPDALLNEFFSRYFGAAAKPMRAFYSRIEEIFNNSDNYPDEVRQVEKQFHQTEEMAWKYLGTEERMKELDALMDRAGNLARGDLEKKRVRTWQEGVWDYMLEGRRMYLAKQE